MFVLPHQRPGKPWTTVFFLRVAERRRAEKKRKRRRVEPTPRPGTLTDEDVKLIVGSTMSATYWARKYGVTRRCIAELRRQHAPDAKEPQ